VRLTPRGGRDAVDGAAADGRVRIRVAAPPAEGAANRALLRLIAAELGVPGSAVAIEAGLASRTKRVRVSGIGPEVVAARWPGVTVRPG
jgi:hypothetical protein